MLQKFPRQTCEYVNSITPQGPTKLLAAHTHTHTHTQRLKMGGESMYVTGNVFLFYFYW